MTFRIFTPYIITKNKKIGRRNTLQASVSLFSMCSSQWALKLPTFLWESVLERNIRQKSSSEMTERNYSRTSCCLGSTCMRCQMYWKWGRLAWCRRARRPDRGRTADRPRRGPPWWKWCWTQPVIGKCMYVCMYVLYCIVYPSIRKRKYTTCTKTLLYLYITKWKQEILYDTYHHVSIQHNTVAAKHPHVFTWAIWLLVVPGLL